VTQSHSSFLEAVSQRVLVFDGATGTSLQSRTVGADVVVHYPEAQYFIA